MESRIVKLETKLEENNKTTYRIFEAIYGNGKPGLIAEIQALKLSIENHHEQHRGVSNGLQWIITAIIAIVAIIVNVIK